MERKSNKHEEKPIEKPKDRGDKTNLLVKVFEELDITDFLPSIRDRGDSTVYFNDKNTRNRHLEETNKRNHIKKPKKSVVISLSDEKTKEPSFILNLDDLSKEEHKVKPHKEDRKKTEFKKSIKEKEDKSGELKKGANEKEDKTGEFKKGAKDKEDRSFPGAKDIRKAYTISEQNPKLDSERRDDARKIDDKIKGINENKVESKRSKVKNLKDLKVTESDALERRKLVRQRYTVKLKNSSKTVESKDSYNKNDDNHLNNEVTEGAEIEKQNESPKEILQQLETTKLAKKMKEPTEAQRKAFIKTIRHNDYSLYKSITFIDRKETTPLQIKMPHSKKSVETNTIKNKLKPIVSKESVQNILKVKPRKDRKNERRLKKRPSSPVLAIYQDTPKTEVAKWAPSSITQDTKPYYEAWVDTTLAATAKISEEEKLKLSNQQIFRTFKRAFELGRPHSPNLIYEEANDERFRGRITVNRRHFVKHKM